ncbi:MAG: GTPase Era [Cryomorphaceae bacterium]|nr:MAG: GTPase Era [Cryomorphaceae bacterium]
MKHRAGFVNIIGKPNVGKSTLMNAVLGESLSIITPKAQTTRHRIMGLLNHPDYQIVFSDTPGLLAPSYKMQERMMNFVEQAFSDADIIIYITIPDEVIEEELRERINSLGVPVLVLLNKIDTSDQEAVTSEVEKLKEWFPDSTVMPVSALHRFNLDAVLEFIIEWLPEHPPYFDKESLSDRPMRFFMSEMIREQIFLHYQKEIPYSAQVEIESFKESEELIHIRAIIYVMRQSQKGIVIGHKGEKLKKVGTGARKSMEKFLGAKVFLELHVKVDENWRDENHKLDKYGYL